MKNNNNVNIFLTLGCCGRSEDGFILCPSCENIIMKVDDGLDNIEAMNVFLNSCSLFDRPHYDYNAIKNILNLINSKFFYNNNKIWSQRELDSMQKFIQMHKQCGLILKLDVSDLTEITEVKDKPIFIQSSSKKLMLKMAPIK